MITKNMYKILTRIPHSPDHTTLGELSKKRILDVNYMSSLLNEAIKNEFVSYSSHSPYNNIHESKIHLTENGQIEIENYRKQKNSSAKATWAIVISALSFITSVIAIIVSSIPG